MVKSEEHKKSNQIQSTSQEAICEQIQKNIRVSTGPGYYFITGSILKMLPSKGTVKLNNLLMPLVVQNICQIY